MQAAVFVRGGPLYLVGDVAFMLGDCTVPALMLVLGGNLSKGERTLGIQKVSVRQVLYGACFDARARRQPCKR